MFWVEKGMEEAKTQVLKNCHCLAFKNKKSAHFAGKVLEKLLAKWPQMHRASFVGSFFSQKSCERVEKLSM